jgi:peptidoglycan/xylan/chitin deacetylase (PgdA/CDA1 family)
MNVTAHAQSDGRTLAILGFHKVGEPPANGWETWFYVPESTFVSYLGYLKQDGWEVLDVVAFLRGLAVPDSLPERAALLTFDDGYRSFISGALPWLLEFGYPSVMFVPTDFIGAHNSFDADDEPEEPICGWDDLRELERQGVSVQSHGVSHRALSTLDRPGQEDEVARSKTILEEGLGKPVEIFAYPYGDGGMGRAWRARRRELREALVRAGYRAACLYGGGPQQFPIIDPYRVSRLAIGPDTDLETELRS